MRIYTATRTKNRDLSPSVIRERDRDPGADRNSAGDRLEAEIDVEGETETE